MKLTYGGTRPFSPLFVSVKNVKLTYDRLTLSANKVLVLGTRVNSFFLCHLKLVSCATFRTLEFSRFHRSSVIVLHESGYGAY